MELARADKSIVAASKGLTFQLRGAVYFAVGERDKATADFLSAIRLNRRDQESLDALAALGVRPNMLVEWVKSFFVTE